jgi:hypothetical protein
MRIIKINMNIVKNKIILIVAFCATFLPFVVSATELYSPIGSVSVPVLIGKILSIVIGVIGAIALAMFIFGGFLWMTSAGDGKAVQKGKDTMVYAVLGLVVIFSARAILTFVFEFLK